MLVGGDDDGYEEDYEFPALGKDSETQVLSAAEDVLRAKLTSGAISPEEYRIILQRHTSLLDGSAMNADEKGQELQERAAEGLPAANKGASTSPSAPVLSRARSDKRLSSFSRKRQNFERSRSRLMNQIDAIFDKFAGGSHKISPHNVPTALAELGLDDGDKLHIKADSGMTKKQFSEVVLGAMINVDPKLAGSVHRKVLMTMHSAPDIRNVLMQEMLQLGVIAALLCGTGIGTLTEGASILEEKVPGSLSIFWFNAYGTLLFVGSVLTFASLVTSTMLFIELNVLPGELGKLFVRLRLRILLLKFLLTLVALSNRQCVD